MAPEGAETDVSHELDDLFRHLQAFFPRGRLLCGLCRGGGERTGLFLLQFLHELGSLAQALLVLPCSISLVQDQQQKVMS